MTWSLKLQGGDLVKGKGNALSTVFGSDKVQQDLLHWILTDFGSDPFSLNYGSIINLEENTIIINDTNNETLFVPDSRLDLVVSEIDRVIERYQTRQLIRLEQENIIYNGSHTFSSGEIIEDYDIEYEQLLDTLYVDIRLSLLSEETKEVSLTVKGQGIG